MAGEGAIDMLSKYNIRKQKKDSLKTSFPNSEVVTRGVL